MRTASEGASHVDSAGGGSSTHRSAQRCAPDCASAASTSSGGVATSAASGSLYCSTTVSSKASSLRRRGQSSDAPQHRKRVVHGAADRAHVVGQHARAKARQIGGQIGAGEAEERARQRHRARLAHALHFAADARELLRGVEAAQVAQRRLERGNVPARAVEHCGVVERRKVRVGATAGAVLCGIDHGNAPRPSQRARNRVVDRNARGQRHGAQPSARLPSTRPSRRSRAAARTTARTPHGVVEPGAAMRPRQARALRPSHGRRRRRRAAARRRRPTASARRERAQKAGPWGAIPEPQQPLPRGAVRAGRRTHAATGRWHCPAPRCAAPRRP